MMIAVLRRSPMLVNPGVRYGATAALLVAIAIIAALAALAVAGGHANPYPTTTNSNSSHQWLSADGPNALGWE
jgi:hypothetical protein